MLVALSEGRSCSCVGAGGYGQGTLKRKSSVQGWRAGDQSARRIQVQCMDAFEGVRLDVNSVPRCDTGGKMFRIWQTDAIVDVPCF